MMLFFQFFKILISNLTGDQPGTGVGAIVGEEPNRCVNSCVCSNCNELEIDNESEIDKSSQKTEVTQVTFHTLNLPQTGQAQV